MIPPCGLAEDDDRSRLINPRKCAHKVVLSYKEEEVCTLVRDHMRPVADIAEENEDYRDDGLMIGWLVS